MNPKDRENSRYSKGASNPIKKDELLMFELVKNKKGDLLDVGCGIGAIANELEKRFGFKIKGVDFSEIAINKAVKNGVDAMVCDVDSEGLPNFNKKFDVVWCGDIIEHLFDPINALTEINKNLKKDGVLVLSVPNDLCLSNRVKVLFGYSQQSKVYRQFNQCKHHTVMSYELINFFLKKSGFKIDKIISLGKIPIIGARIEIKNRVLASIFGNVFMIRAIKC